MWIAEKAEKLAKIFDELSYRQVAILFSVVDFAAHITGLLNPFQGDDFLQIVSNPLVHSLANVATFFQGSTFYNGGGLTGSYYRPLMTTTFSLIYSVFGKSSFFFHFFQLILVGAGAFLLFYILKRLLKSQSLAIMLGLLFLVHPLNSQVAFAIPSMQDALVFFFGCLGLYFVMRQKSESDIYWSLLSLFAAMLSKETGILFVGLALGYLYLWDRARLKLFTIWSLVPIVIWFFLRINAVGLFNNPNIAPIDRLSLSDRLLTTPSILATYMGKLIFPWDLASAYYWVHRSVSLGGVVIPLATEGALVALIVYGGLVLKKKADEQLYQSYIFFATWFIVGLLPVLQIAPLDLTFSETWFYFSTAGLLGVLGVVFMVYKKKIHIDWLTATLVVLIVVLSVRTIARGTDWSSASTLDRTNIAASKEDYVAYNDLSHISIGQGKYSKAADYARKSIEIFPYFGNYNNLGSSLMSMRDFHGARAALTKGLAGHYVAVYENLAALDLVDGGVDSNKQYYVSAVKAFPQDGKLWLYKAIFDAKNSDYPTAQYDVNQAVHLGYSVPQPISSAITTNQPLTLQTSLGSIKLNPTR